MRTLLVLCSLLIACPLRAQEADTVRVLERALQHRLDQPGVFLPFYQDRQRERLARQLLVHDSTHALAHYVLGTLAWEEFDDLYARASFSHFDEVAAHRQEEALADAAWKLSVLRASDGTLRFVEAQETGAEVPVTENDRLALKQFQTVLHHLQASVARDPARWEAYRPLLDACGRVQAWEEARAVLDQMHTAFADSADYWLYRGYVQYRQDDVEAATESFRQGLDRLSVTERRAFEDITAFLPVPEQHRQLVQPEAVGRAFWQNRDPRLLTRANERQLEHYARLVYADLRFGQMGTGQRGWDTQPGEVVVRYGPPLKEVAYGSRKDRFRIFHYGDFEFRFMDLARTGHYVFYSPRAEDFSGFRPDARVLDHDYALRGPETFRARPEQFVPQDERRIPFPYQSSRLRGADGRTDVVVAFDAPLPADTATVASGAFLLRTTDGLVEQQQSRSQASGTVRDDTTWWGGVHTLSAVPGDYTLAIEFEAGARGYERTPLTLPDFHSGGLMVSDLVLAASVVPVEAATEEGGLVRHGMHLRPIARPVFSLQHPIALYFEVYHLRPGPDGRTRYDVEAVLVRAEGRGGLERRIAQAFGRTGPGGVSVRFAAQGTTADEAHDLVFDPLPQMPGTWVLVVRITDRVQQATAETRQTLTLRAP
jgi:GWxTD domain-containing protein